MQEQELEDLNLLKIHETEAPTLESTSLHDHLEGNLIVFPPDQISPSTRLLQLAQAPIVLQPHFQLHSAILRGRFITEQMRAKIRTHLMEECCKQCLLRETYVLACTLIDLFFAHGGSVESSQFQSLALACLILATKIKEGKFPTISFQIFSRQQLMNFEKAVAARLQYKLTPPTYHDYAERIAYLWNAYTLQNKIYSEKNVEASMEVNRVLRKFYEQLDCVYLVLKSLDFDLEDVVVNLFYINARMLNLETPTPTNITDAQFQAAFYPPSDRFRIFFEAFLQLYSKRTKWLNAKLGGFLRLFAGVQSGQKEWRICGGQQALVRMREWDKFQSLPDRSYALAKSIMQRLAKTE